MKAFPQTILELEQWMKDNCYRIDGYSINGNRIYEGFGMEKPEEVYHWYYTERGQKDILKRFQTEEEAVAYAFRQIREDIWARAHCIGFSTDPFEMEALAHKLSERRIVYFQDDIPYYAKDKPVFRTFVLGCDHLRVGDLKEEYYKKDP